MSRMMRPMFKNMFITPTATPGQFDYPFAFTDDTNFSDVDPVSAQYWSDQVSSGAFPGLHDYEDAWDDETLWDDDDPLTAQYWDDQQLSAPP